ncbi:MAG TPA: DUF898 family protein [Xanthobacteraceae bacterium]|nr:DUF898 family protein [Xanthobacteraceae bacterium]
MNVVAGSGASPLAAVPSIPPASAPPADSGTGRFHGREGAFFALLVRGSLFLMLTLGIYRFWLATDVRRFLWGNTEIAGDALEYTGTAKELLIGFLMAVVLLLPVNALIFLATFTPGLLKFSGLIGFLLLAVLGQFAVFRARRYRLTRTVFRGVRLHQTGSAWAYAFRSVVWWLAILLTAGLAYPWATANLERFKMRHTHYGDLTGRFEGSGTRLFLRGVLLWLVVVVPFLAALVAAVAAVDWEALARTLAASGANARQLFDEASPSLAAAIVFASAGIGWAVLAAALLYPLFRAMTLRWWLSGLRLGGVRAESCLRTGQVYALYLRFVGFAVLFAMAAMIFAGLVFGFLSAASKSFGDSQTIEILSTALGLGAYVAVMLGYSAIYQATVVIRFWRLSFETTELFGLRALENVKAVAGPSSPLGEGLADALDVGGL